MTLRQISKVKSATEAQQEAISNLRLRLASFDAIQECAHAQMHLESLRSAIQIKDTAEAIVLYDKLAICFINLAELGSVSQEVTSDLRVNADRVGRISKALESVELSPIKHLEIARDFHALLMKVRFEIHREQ